jgi:hypothetical protein
MLDTNLVALGGPVVNVLATGPKVVGSNKIKDDGFLWVIKIHSMCFLQRESKAIGPML